MPGLLLLNNPVLFSSQHEKKVYKDTRAVHFRWIISLFINFRWRRTTNIFHLSREWFKGIERRLCVLRKKAISVSKVTVKQGRRKQFSKIDDFSHHRRIKVRVRAHKKIINLRDCEIANESAKRTFESEILIRSRTLSSFNCGTSIRLVHRVIECFFLYEWPIWLRK